MLCAFAFQDRDKWIEELQKRPKMISSKTHKLARLPEMLNVGFRCQYQQCVKDMRWCKGKYGGEVRKLKDEYKYLVWCNNSALAWWDIEGEVNVNITTIVQLEILKQRCYVLLIMYMEIILIFSLIDMNRG